MDVVMPQAVARVVAALHEAGYQAVLVGGCVRDLLLGHTPADWDVATSATPAEIIRFFPDANLVGAAFGTVLVGAEAVEVTTFRREADYRDGRHPEAVEFTTSLGEDLLRRDFTVNALAWDPQSRQLIDTVGGLADLRDRLVRAVGDPARRFQEDALRLLRLVRFACQLDFDIETETWQAAEGLAAMTDRLSRERVRDELVKTLATADPGRGLWMLYELGILTRVIPEMAQADRLPQGKRGAPTLLDHLIQTVAACPDDAGLRLAALLHDIGKITTRQVTPAGRVVFHGHEEESVRLAELILRRLRFDNATVARVLSLVRHHMASGPVTEKTIRRWLAAHGAEWIRDLLALRRADHVASGGSEATGCDTATATLERVLSAEGVITRRDLKVSGHDIMQHLQLPPGPLVGRIITGLYELVLEQPENNQRDWLLSRAEQLLAEYRQGQVP